MVTDRLIPSCSTVRYFSQLFKSDVEKVEPDGLSVRESGVESAWEGSTMEMSTIPSTEKAAS